MNKIDLFLQQELQNPKNWVIKEFYERKNFSNEELLYLFPNNKLKHFGLPMKKGGTKKKRHKRKIIRSQHLFNIIEDVFEDTLGNYDFNPYFQQFVSFKDINVGDTNVFYVSDYEEKCKGVFDEYIRESRYQPIRTIRTIDKSSKINY